jgi:hypothetical protein
MACNVLFSNNATIDNFAILALVHHHIHACGKLLEVELLSKGQTHL